ncbi:MAG: signal recognition particle protein [Candidatus Nitronauta litoralis]|uniref:Signal recognition particle protein n=1 Tax=Candidatus Nitronauta litoralis TaxID=2705533 RepID=A0A7T0G018_9BACT|nr:MAG: signal recognition particle protein [Candidatus Nitronauta litoralis]
MFENLSGRLEDIYNKIKGRGKLKEADVDEALKEIRVALIEADVSLPVIKDFLEQIREKAIGQEVMESLTPGHMMVKVVNEELILLFGDAAVGVQISPEPPTIILMAGLQGSGKTTTCGKLARMLKKDGKNVLLVPADVYRPAAIEQLNVLGRDLEIDVFQAGDEKDPVAICKNAVAQARKDVKGVVILDTAGRQQVDDELMEELRKIKGATDPHEILFVADAMMGQQAAEVAKTFHDAVGLDGVVLTKMDGDARGGAALSIKSVTGKPIKFIGTGEKLDAFEAFHPDRIVSRMLDMGDVLTFIDKAQEAYDLEQSKKLQKKIKKNEFDFDDFRDQLRQIKKMGSMQQMLAMIPGASKLLKGVEVDESQFTRIEAMIDSMTPYERANHQMINTSRKKRIAQGSGTQVNEVKRLLKQFVQMKKMMKKFSSGKMPRGLNLGGMLGR